MINETYIQPLYDRYTPNIKYFYRTRSENFLSANELRVTVEHNGFQGGNAGHGGYVRIILQDVASTAMFLNGEECEEVELVFRGDCERDTLLDALKMIVHELESNTSVKETNGKLFDPSSQI